MKTNAAFNKITIDSANRPKVRIPLSHDVNTTASIGDVQPLLCRQLIPKSKTSLSMRHLIRLDPMVAPTYGRLKVKCWSHFVGLSDLLPRSVPAMLTKAPVAKGTLNSVPSVPTELPNITLCDLAASILVGAQFTVYFHTPTSTEGADSSLTNWRTYSYSDTATAVTDFKAWIASHLVFGVSNGFVGYNGGSVDLSALGAQFGNTAVYIPINSSGTNNVSGVPNRFFVPPNYLSENSWDYVPLNSADYVLRTSFTNGSNSYEIAFATRLSAFGKRMRKILIGLGYQPNLSDGATQVDATPLFAYYKAYWDTFGLTLYDNWGVLCC